MLLWAFLHFVAANSQSCIKRIAQNEYLDCKGAVFQTKVPFLTRAGETRDQEKIAVLSSIFHSFEVIIFASFSEILLDHYLIL